MNEKFEEWAIVELFGHQRIAGKVSEQVVGGCSFVRVDVPESEDQQPMTKLYGNGAIYAITLVDEETARAAARKLSVEPVARYSLRSAISRHIAQLAAGDGDLDLDDEDYEDLFDDAL